MVTASGAVAASPDDASQLQTAIAAADAGEPVRVSALPVVSSVARAAPASEAFADLDRSAAPPYRPDLTLLAAVLGAGVLLIGTAAALRARPAA